LKNWIGTDSRRRRAGRLSVVLRPSQYIRDGQPVTVTLASGRTVQGYARRLDEEAIRVELPEGVF
jgi:hypothetical protein